MNIETILEALQHKISQLNPCLWALRRYTISSPQNLEDYTLTNRKNTTDCQSFKTQWQNFSIYSHNIAVTQCQCLQVAMEEPYLGKSAYIQLEGFIPSLIKNVRIVVKYYRIWDKICSTKVFSLSIFLKSISKNINLLRETFFNVGNFLETN